MKTSLKTALITAAVAMVAIALSSCSLTLGPDGSKSGTIDGAAAAQVIKIFAEK